MTIAIDFDGTCVTHEYPNVGKDIGAIPVLKKLVDKGHQLILYTMRDGKELQDAVDWFKENNIELYGIQKNPTQHKWTSSPKCYAELYIDDAALGIPLIKNDLKFKREDFLNKYRYSPFLSPVQRNGFCYYYVARPYVDWESVKSLLKLKKII